MVMTEHSLMQSQFDDVRSERDIVHECGSQVGQLSGLQVGRVFEYVRRYKEIQDGVADELQTFVGPRESIPYVRSVGQGLKIK